MKARLLPALAAAVLLLGGCTTPEEEEVELSLPTQEEADAAAASRISRQNADSELAKLTKEIESEP